MGYRINKKSKSTVKNSKPISTLPIVKKNDKKELVTNNAIKDEKQSTMSEVISSYEYKTFKVVGVTFKNEDGTERQKVLRAINEFKPPHDENRVVTIESYDYKGEQAFSVFVNDIQIGNLARDDIPYLKKFRTFYYNHRLKCIWW